jgi:hypothetical protein
MPRRLLIVIGFAAFASAVLPNAAAHAGYGAIAWDPETGRAGWVWNRSTPREAAELARRQCQAAGCRIIIKPTDACAALATTADGKAIGAAARKTKEEAQRAALGDCEKRNTGACVVRASNCNK